MSVTLTTATDETLYFEVSSSSRPETHDVYYDIHDGWICTCEHHFFRKAECKHIQACKEWLLENKNYTIIGISHYGITVYGHEMILQAQRMGTYYEIKGGLEECNFHQEAKLKV